MADVVLQAAVTSAAALGVGVMRSRSENRAGSAQERAAAEALAYQRERDADSRNRYDAYQREYQERYDQWLERVYGVRAPDRRRAPMIGTPPGQTPVVPGAAPGAPPPGAVPPGVSPTFGAAPATAPFTVQQSVPPMAGQQRPPRTVSDIAGWNDWTNYLGRKPNVTA